MDESDFSDGNEEGDEGKGDALDPNNPDHFFPIMEKQFNTTLAAIEQNPEASQFADDYNKLFESFYQTYTKKEELEDKTIEMSQEIDEKSNSVAILTKIAEEDAKTIEELKNQVNEAWKLADGAHAREQVAQEIIDNLRRQVENLNAEIEFKNKMNQDTEEVGELSKHKDGLERERDRLINEVTQLNTKLQNALGYQEELERKNSQADMRINEICGQLEDQSGEINRQKRAREKVENDITELKYKLEEKEAQANDLNSLITQHLKLIQRLEQDIKDVKASHDRIAKEHEATSVKYAKLKTIIIIHFSKRIKSKEVYKKNFWTSRVSTKMHPDSEMRSQS
ncbi:hypothetical protein JTB14_012290 [Gonioctena quinquepunctata]|nr:hypothetical protein JTB14_012290 [Gonioctena quinquepunctata]